MYYFTSDTHFQDPKVLKYRYRPFASVDEMNERLVEIWNSIVNPDDVVYHLGDSAVTAEGLNEFVPRLNGHKRLIYGNYEVTLPATDIERIFEEIHIEPIILHLDGVSLQLAHYPLQRREDVDWNLCGHIHDLWKITKSMMNVSVDAWHFRPVSEVQVLEAIAAQRDGRWDANVYPDADLDWQQSVSWRERPWWEPTKAILAEKQREAEERIRNEWIR